MAMRATTVRFGEDLWAMLDEESARAGVSAAQFVREAAILRLAALAGRRGDPDVETTIADIAARATRRSNGESPLSRTLTDPGRLAALHGGPLIDAEPNASFDRIAGLAAKVLNAPVALVSGVDRDRQYFKSCLGLPEPWASSRQSPLSHSFCQHAVARREPLVVSDAREVPELMGNRAIQEMGAIAYLGIPLIPGDGHAVGTLCVIDHQPRVWTSDQVDLLKDLAASVVTEINLRRAAQDPDGAARAD